MGKQKLCEHGKRSGRCMICPGFKTQKQYVKLCEHGNQKAHCEKCGGFGYWQVRGQVQVQARQAEVPVQGLWGIELVQAQQAEAQVQALWGIELVRAQQADAPVQGLWSHVPAQQADQCVQGVQVSKEKNSSCFR